MFRQTGKQRQIGLQMILILALTQFSQYVDSFLLILYNLLRTKLSLNWSTSWENFKARFAFLDDIV